MSSLFDTHLNPLDRERLRADFQAARPFHFICVDGLLRAEFAEQVARAYPTFAEARRVGKTFATVNERGKVQISDPQHFPEPIRTLHEILAAPEFLATLSHITDIPALLADEQLAGGGMHLMAANSRLDLHADFNIIPRRGLYRRLNILLFLNRDWPAAWGGGLQLWDATVTHCDREVAPILNRCVLFETTAPGFHGVSKVGCPEAMTRNSFAAYYYTTQPPPDWTGPAYSTEFRARPDEWLKGLILMPAETIGNQAIELARRAKRRLGQIVRGL
ncbi:MAG: 2OG-Fe(II) oxygenase [Deltaproteobacteria bacterium]|nr:2OG-Fe(II) oxygenase [Deltaproteobacteria bacterium]MBI3386207.1 2OG-Fe(II) oxygenase [Deltaproteobacteria bacterium]